MVINPIVGVYIPIITIPIKGEMTIPNIGSLDPGTHAKYELSTFAGFYLFFGGNLNETLAEINFILNIFLFG